MKLCLVNHSFRYELEKLIRIFLPFEKIEFLNQRVEGDSVAVVTLGDKACAELFLCGERFYSSRVIEAVKKVVG